LHIDAIAEQISKALQRQLAMCAGFGEKTMESVK
jgi:hypothetical protein